MISRNTWLALLVLGGLVAYTVFLNNKPGPAEETATPQESQSESLFGPEDGLATRIRIESATGQIVEVGLGPNGDWYVRKPIEATADQSQVEAAASQIGSLQKLAELELGPEAAGLSKPAYTITIGFTGGKDRVVKIGVKTPTEAGYYARLDGGKVLIVSVDGIDSLLGLLTTPPYLETPTPSPVPATSTPIPTQGKPASTVTPKP